MKTLTLLVVLGMMLMLSACGDDISMSAWCPEPQQTLVNNQCVPAQQQNAQAKEHL